MIILKIIGLTIIGWLIGSFFYGVLEGLYEEVEPDRIERMSFDGSDVFCIKCEWQGWKSHLIGRSCPWCGEEVCVFEHEIYYTIDGPVTNQKRMRELHQ